MHCTHLSFSLSFCIAHSSAICFLSCPRSMLFPSLFRSANAAFLTELSSTVDVLSLLLVPGLVFKSMPTSSLITVRTSTAPFSTFCYFCAEALFGLTAAAKPFHAHFLDTAPFVTPSLHSVLIVHLRLIRGKQQTFSDFVVISALLSGAALVGTSATKSSPVSSVSIDCPSLTFLGLAKSLSSARSSQLLSISKRTACSLPTVALVTITLGGLDSFPAHPQLQSPHH